MALAKGVESVKLDGIGVLLVDERGEPLRLKMPVQIRRVGDTLRVDGRKVRRLIASGPACVRINGRGYRGSVEIEPFERGMLVVNELPLEEYLAGLINGEISSQWPMEIVKAQAVIARTYALYQKNLRGAAPYHLEATVLDQVYDGCDRVDSRAIQGVEETAGEVLTYEGKIIQAFYHSICGGTTEAVENVWGASLPYLTGVTCDACLTAPNFQWEQSFPVRKLEQELRGVFPQVSGLKGVRAGSRSRSGRLTELIAVTPRGERSIPAVAFRKTLGYTVVRSTNFEVRTVGGTVFLSGIGYGHGVGLCQWGARQRAAEGADYRDILAHYYPGTTLTTLQHGR